jgi:hypothetical protein
MSISIRSRNTVLALIAQELLARPRQHGSLHTRFIVVNQPRFKLPSQLVIGVCCTLVQVCRVSCVVQSILSCPLTRPTAHSISNSIQPLSRHQIDHQPTSLNTSNVSDDCAKPA